MRPCACRLPIQSGSHPGTHPASPFTSPQILGGVPLPWWLLPLPLLKLGHRPGSGHCRLCQLKVVQRSGLGGLGHAAHQGQAGHLIAGTDLRQE